MNGEFGETNGRRRRNLEKVWKYYKRLANRILSGGTDSARTAVVDAASFLDEELGRWYAERYRGRRVGGRRVQLGKLIELHPALNGDLSLQIALTTRNSITHLKNERRRLKDPDGHLVLTREQAITAVRGFCRGFRLMYGLHDSVSIDDTARESGWGNDRIASKSSEPSSPGLAVSVSLSESTDERPAIDVIETKPDIAVAPEDGAAVPKAVAATMFSVGTSEPFRSWIAESIAKIDDRAFAVLSDDDSASADATAGHERDSTSQSDRDCRPHHEAPTTSPQIPHNRHATSHPDRPSHHIVNQKLQDAATLLCAAIEQDQHIQSLCAARGLSVSEVMMASGKTSATQLLPQDVIIAADRFRDLAIEYMRGRYGLAASVIAKIRAFAGVGSLGKVNAADVDRFVKTARAEEWTLTYVVDGQADLSNKKKRA